MTDSGHTSDRRTILRTIAAGGAIAASGGLASAKPASPRTPELRRLAEAEEQLGDLDTVQQIFADHGRTLAESLAEQGYLSTGPSISSVVSRSDFADLTADGVAAIADGTVNGEHAIDVRVKQRTDDHDVEYHLYPEREYGYAKVTPHDGGTSVVMTPDGSVTEVTSACCPSSDPNYNCDDNCGSTRCTTNYCGCDQKVDYAVYKYDKERKCCQVATDGSGNEECLCSWSVVDCACEEQKISCPTS